MKNRCQKSMYLCIANKSNVDSSKKNRGKAASGGKCKRDQETKKAEGKKNREAVTRVRDSSHGISHNASRSLRCTGCSSGTDRAPLFPRSCSLSWSAFPPFPLHVVLAHRFYTSSLVGIVVFLIYILPLATTDWTEKKRRGHTCNAHTYKREKTSKYTNS